ncbi:uncharacterized protein ColSpa_09057 [Colletotrichum spaethianum]|uniref:Uncharacterized protein n=1 Tax=Colletotrichum spaethianum TaxID=700344 RepID=A0AA37PAV7_9PEZI|nr:uncharacterized protein ColSpa_09057 [Colletotrichum spaethianum]GKT48876.1 hypothetical protein ColSpa_09057 [Colletotrichum spaethianum]
MPRRHRSSKRSCKHRQANLEPDFVLAKGHVVNEKNHHYRPRKDGNSPRRCRGSSIPSGPSKKHRHDRHTRRIAIETDTDGDFAMLPTPPTSPETPLLKHATSRKDGHNKMGIVEGRSRRYSPERYPSPRSPKVFTRGPITSAQQVPGEVTWKSFRFRHHILSLLDQQRAAVESWADSVGAGGPAEPMDWQPEQERVVYIARDPVEYGCYEDRWRVDRGLQEEGQQYQQGVLAMATTSTPFVVQPELGSRAGETPLDGSRMWGTSAIGLGFLGEIE